MGYSVSQKPQQNPLKVRKPRQPAPKTGPHLSDGTKEEIPRSCLLLFGDVKADPNDDSDDSGDEAQLKSELASDVEPKSESDDGNDSDASSLDDEEELARELAAIRREREERMKEEQEASVAMKQDDLRDAVAAGLREPSGTASNDWTEDSVFNVIHREERPKYVNDLVRSDFHRRFLARYIL